MSAPFVIPFNNNPSSVSVKTASYTIPAGKYALLTVNLIGSATFTIGGVTALQGTQNDVLGSSVVDAFNVQTAGGATSGQGIITTSGTFATTFAAFATAIDQKTVISQVWVPTGTVISGTGTFRIIVQEYNVIS